MTATVRYWRGTSASLGFVAERDRVSGLGKWRVVAMARNVRRFIGVSLSIAMATLGWRAVGVHAESPMSGNVVPAPDALSPADVALQKHVRVNVRERGLVDVLAMIQKKIGVPLVIDAAGMKAEGVSEQTPVTIDISRDCRAYEILSLVLEPLHLVYVSRGDTIAITSEQDADVSYLHNMVMREAAKLCVEGGDGDGLAEAFLCAIEDGDRHDPRGPLYAGHRQQTYEKALDFILHFQEKMAEE
ncbi:MAG: hypothetical protein K8T91_03005 [Planctomycetes bacterium]|nr:hypothetical protein [Planctomycetota bacterium]